MTKVLILCGEKQSGKDSSANYVTGCLLKQAGVISQFAILDDGSLVVPCVVNNQDGTQTRGEGVLDLNRATLGDFEFAKYASENIWPTVKVYHFADLLKRSVSEIFNLPLNLLYGTDDDKNLETKIAWKNCTRMMIPNQIKALKESGKYDSNLSIRELLQFFGTDMCRHLDDNCWVRATFAQIEIEQPEFAIIADGRFPNEITFSDNYHFEEVKSIYLTKSIGKSEHKSENALKSFDGFSRIINNAALSIGEKNELLLSSLYEWKWLKGTL